MAVKMEREREREEAPQCDLCCHRWYISCISVHYVLAKITWITVRNWFTVKSQCCAVAQHCCKGDLSFLWGKWNFWPIKFKPLNSLTENLSQLIMSTRGMSVPSVVKIRSRGSSGQIGEMSLSCAFYFSFLRHVQRSEPLTDFDSQMAQNMQNHARMCLFGVRILNFNIWPLFTPRCQILAPKWQFQAKMLKHESSSISETVEPIDVKI